MGVDAKLTGVPEFSQLQLIKSGKATLNGNATAGVSIATTVAHNLGFVPVVIAYFTDSTGSLYYSLPNSLSFSASGGNMTFATWTFATTDATNLYINFISGSTANWGTLYYKYFLFRETSK